MPFASQSQAGWAFATGQPFAHRWARETGSYKKLPVKLKANYGAKRGQTIAGRLMRGEGGRFSSSGGALPSKRVPYKKLPKGAAAKRGGKGRKPAAARKPAKTDAQRAQERQAAQAKRQQERAAEQEQNIAKTFDALGLPEDAADSLKRLAAGEAVDDDGGLVKMGLAEQAADGSYRLTPAGRQVMRAAERGDLGTAKDAASRAAEAAAEAAKPKGGGGGGKKKKPEEKPAGLPRLSRPLRASSSGGDGGGGKGSGGAGGNTPELSQELRDAARKLSDGEYISPTEQDALIRNGLARITKGVLVLTAAGLRATTKAEEYGGVKRSNLDDSVFAGPDRSFPIKTAQDVKDAVRSLGRTKHDKAAVKRGIIRRARAIGAVDALPESWRAKSFAVFKDATGAMRWLARTTTAFEDRDSEVISQKALEDSAASSAQRGPLRFWHMGKPDPLATSEPWGPGVDLGWCDFAAIEGRTLIESGIFKSEAIGRAVAARADQLELSPGFFHAAGEPDASGVFHHIRIFERSIVPKWAGRASNPYTGLVVEKAMDQKKLDALRVLVPEATIKELLADVATTEKAAEADGVRYKETEAPAPVETPELTIVERFKAFLAGEQPSAPAPVVKEAPPAAEPAPDPLAALTAQVAALTAELATLKAGPPMLDAEDDPAQGGDSGADEAAEGEPPLDDTGGGEMSADEFIAAIGDLFDAKLAPLIEALGITTKLDGHLGELKSLLGGYVKTKDDERAQMTARLDQTDARLAELDGSLPRAGYRASQATDNTVEALTAALKDAPNAGEQLPFADQIGHWFPNMAAPR